MFEPKVAEEKTEFEYINLPWIIKIRRFLLKK